MERRFLLQGGAAGLLAMLTGCGGGDGGGDGDGDGDGNGGGGGDGGGGGGGSDFEISGDEGYEHSFGLNMLPDANMSKYSTEFLSQLTPDTSFEVLVKIGAQLQAGVPVKIYDARNSVIDMGVTNEEGKFVSTQPGRYFLFAVAEVNGSELYGMEFNFAQKSEPVIEVNFLATIFHQVYQRLQASGKSTEFVIQRFFGIEPDVLISDLDVYSQGLNQDLIRAEYEASGLELSKFIAQLIDKIMVAVEQGFIEESFPYGGQRDTAMKMAALSRLAAEPFCMPQDFDFDRKFVYEKSAVFNDGNADVIDEAINKYWPVATKKLLEFGAGKAAIIAGSLGGPVSSVGGLIIGALFPPEDTVGKAIEAATTKIIASIDNAMQRVIDRINVLDFESRFLLVKATFDKIYTQIKKIEAGTRLYKKIENPTDEEKEEYKRNALNFAQALIDIEDRLTQAHNIFFGIGGGYHRNDSVLEKWFTLVRGDKFYTSLVQDEFLAILNYFLFYNNIAYTYLVDAYATRAELRKETVKQRVGIIRERWDQSVFNIEAVRPKYLVSEKQVIDLHFNLTWLGRCNKISIAQFEDIIGRNGSRSRDTAKMAGMRYVSPLNSCRPVNDPVAGPGISENVVKAFNWVIPSLLSMNSSFSDEIKKMAKADKKFNLGIFADKHRIPAAFFFMENGDEPEPVRVLLDSYKKMPTAPFIGTGLFMADFYSLKNLRQETNYAHTLNSTAWFFPVAQLSADNRKQMVPWEKFNAAYSSLKSLNS